MEIVGSGLVILFLNLGISELRWLANEAMERRASVVACGECVDFMEWILAAPSIASGRRIASLWLLWFYVTAVVLLSTSGAAESRAPACNSTLGNTTPPSEGEQALL